MSGLDRFTAFLRGAAASYNQPPQVPREALWMDVEEGVADSAAAPSRATGGLGGAGAPAGADPADDIPIQAPGYRAAPPPPRDEMWERVEASWALRNRAEAPRAHGSRWPLRGWTRQQRTAGWATALAAAASLVLWMGLDRSAEPTPVAQSEPAGPDVVAEQPPVEVGEASEPILESEAEAPVVADRPASESDDAVGASVDHPVPTTVETRVADLSHLDESGDDYVRTGHLDRAATLLTAFRIDHRTPASETELASWASELLMDTRTFLDMPVSRTPLERALLEDLELVLLQISRLGPGVPEFEWQLARESMEWNGTLMRVRAASAAGET